MEYEYEEKSSATEDQLRPSATNVLEVEPDTYQSLLAVRTEIFDNYQKERDSTPPLPLIQSTSEVESSNNRVAALVTLKEENERQEMKFEILRRLQEGESQNSLAREFGLSKKQVFNIAHGKSRLDGSTKPGRRTGLLPITEVLLAHEIAWLGREKLVTLTGEDFSRYCRALWRAEGNIGEPPKFGQKYRRGFSKRHKNLAFKAYRVDPKRNARHQAASVSNVSYCLNGIKLVLGKVDASHVYCVDELDVSANDQGLGEKRLAVAGVKPIHVTNDNTPHISACPFIPLDGSKGYNAFVVQGALGLTNFASEETKKRIDIFTNSKGSVDTDTWRKIIKGFVEFVDDEFGIYNETRSYCLYLLLDEFQVHTDAEALNLLEEHGVKVFCIPPNLTHVIQINDHGRINGKIQQTVRRRKAKVCQQNGNRMISIEHWCRQVDNIIWTVVEPDSVMEAAKSIGIVYSDESTKVSMSNESIEKAVADMLRTGRIIRDDEVADSEYVELRDRGYVDFLKIASQCNIPFPRMIKEKTIKAMEAYSDQLLFERTGEMPPARQRRAYKRVSSPTASRPCEVRVLANPVTGVAKRKYEALKATESAKQQKKEQKLKKRIEREQKAAQKQSRFEDLQASFGGIDIVPFKRSVARYLSGTQPRENAVRILNKRLKLADPCD